MPESAIGWAMFAYFTVGAAGGCLVIGILVMEAWKKFSKVRTAR